MATGPYPFRINKLDEEALQELGGKPADILRRGIHLQVQMAGKGVHAMYPRSVEDEDVQLAIDEAVEAALDRLDELLPGKNSESEGINSNFRGVLVEQITAMMTGRHYSDRTTMAHLNPLFGDWRSFGRHIYPEKNQGVTLMMTGSRVDELEGLFYDHDRKGFHPLSAISIGALFTAPEYAVKAGFEWLRREESSPKQFPLQLAIIEWDPDTGKRTVVKIAEQ